MRLLWSPGWSTQRDDRRCWCLVVFSSLPLVSAAAARRRRSHPLALAPLAHIPTRTDAHARALATMSRFWGAADDDDEDNDDYSQSDSGSDDDDDERQQQQPKQSRFLKGGAADDDDDDEDKRVVRSEKEKRTDQFKENISAIRSSLKANDWGAVNSGIPAVLVCVSLAPYRSISLSLTHARTHARSLSCCCMISRARQAFEADRALQSRHHQARQPALRGAHLARGRGGLQARRVQGGAQEALQGQRQGPEHRQAKDLQALCHLQGRDHCSSRGTGCCLASATPCVHRPTQLVRATRRLLPRRPLLLRPASLLTRAMTMMMSGLGAMRAELRPVLYVAERASAMPSEQLSTDGPILSTRTSFSLSRTAR